MHHLAAATAAEAAASRTQEQFELIQRTHNKNWKGPQADAHTQHAASSSEAKHAMLNCIFRPQTCLHHHVAV
jgi:hypothetical protein